MGGSDPFIVLSTDDMSGLVDNAIAARLDNTGQSCNAAKRFIVAENLYDDFVAKFTEKMLQHADGITPLSSQAAADRLQAQVDAAVAGGAKLASAGERRGAFFPVGVLTDIDKDNPAYYQELFGPVAMVFKASDEEEALRIANDTPFGLGSYVFTTDSEQAARVADRIEAGMVFVNGVLADGVELPFGGIKRSGFGREMGTLGIDEFVNKKLIRTVA
jgi:succinate-semialdehyde dehydrogenase/glutarate-semialdehyde dehydrogenase